MILEYSIFQIFKFFLYLFSFLVAVIISIILLIRIIKEKSKTGKYNIIRILILGIFIFFAWALFWEFLYDNTDIRVAGSYEIVMAKDTFSFYNVGVALMITFALTMVFYYNQWKLLYLVPFIILFVLFVIFLFSGYGLTLLFYIYGGAILVLVLMINNSFRLKDNNLLGLCVFFVLAFISNILGGTFIGLIFSLVCPIFGLVFALGYFKPFKEKSI